MNPSGGRYSDFPLLELHDVAYASSWRCDAVCMHCFLSRQERIVDSYNDSVFLRLVDDLPHYISRVGLTGGEPFLFPDRLVSHVDIIHGAGRDVTVVTNGFWMEDRHAAFKMIEMLASAGLSALSVSLDGYHRPMPTTDDVRACLRVASDLGIAVKVKGTGRDALSFQQPFVDEGLSPETHLDGDWSSLERIGTARDLGADQHPKAWSSPDCLFALDPVILPDGRLVACCSPRLMEFEGTILNLGEIMTEDLGAILDRYCRDYLIAALVTLGPSGLARIAGVDLSPKLTQCQSCMSVLKDPGAVTDILGAIGKDRQLRKEIVGRAMLLPDRDARCR